MTANPFDGTSYDDCGLDISHHNGQLNFNLLGTTGGRKYCIPKLTEGTTVHDPAFGGYLTGLIASNIKRLGVYHFAHHGDPIGQMQFFIKTFTAATRGIQ